MNLYAGVRADDGSWEVLGYAKNLFNTQRVLTRESTPYSVAYSVTSPSGSGLAVSNYRGITTTEPREFGITARFAFGSR